MKYGLMYAAMLYITACADDTGGNDHTRPQRLARAIFWPLTVTSWFRSQNQRLHRMLTILWICLISAWMLTLLADRL